MFSKGAKRMFCLLPAVLCASLFISCDNPEDNGTWAKAYGDDSRNWTNHVLQLANGGFAVAGYASLAGLDADGVIVWQKTFGHDGRCVFPDAMAGTPDGGLVFGTGISEETGSPLVYDSSIIAVKLDRDGTPVWQKKFSDAAQEFETLNSCDVDDTTGDLYAAGTVGTTVFIRKLDAAGGLLWSRKAVLDTPESVYMYSPVVSAVPGLGCVFAYRTTEANCNVIARMNAHGSIEWQKSLVSAGVPDNPDDIVYGESIRSIRPTADGGFIVLGNCGGTPWVLKLDAGGNRVWAEALNDFIPESKYPAILTGMMMVDSERALYEMPEGGFVLAGSSRYNRHYMVVPGLYYCNYADYAGWIVRLNADGSVAWQKGYRDTTTTRSYRAENDDEYGNAFVTNYENSIELASFSPVDGGGFIAAGSTGRFGPGAKNWLIFVADENGVIDSTKLKIADIDITVTSIGFFTEDVTDAYADEDTVISDIVTTATLTDLTATDI